MEVVEERLGTLAEGWEDKASIEGMGPDQCLVAHTIVS